MPPRKATERQKAQMKIYNVAHRETIRLQKAEQYRIHKEEKKACSKEYYYANREKILSGYKGQAAEKAIYNAQWQATHQEQVKAYRKAHREEGLLACTRRYARKRGLPDTLTLEQWGAIKAAYQYKCAYCNGAPSQLAKDHIIPLSKGGGTTVDNIVPSCTSCNSRKHTNPPSIPVKVLLF